MADDSFYLRWILRLILFPLIAFLANGYFWKVIHEGLRRKP